jgi:hypothetical protein
VTITPTINRFDTEINPNLALIDASKGSSDGTSSVTKHDANSTNEIPAEATTHGNSKLVPQGNGFYNIVDNEDAPITNVGATITANSSSSPLLPDAAITTVQARLDQVVAIDDLVAETKQVMIAADKSLLNTKMEDPHSSGTLEIVREVSNSLFVTPVALQPPLLRCPGTPIRPPVSPVAAQLAQASHHLLQPAI